MDPVYFAYVSKTDVQNIQTTPTYSTRDKGFFALAPWGERDEKPSFGI